MSGRSRPWGAVATIVSLVTLVFAVLSGGAAYAQVQTGSILVKVADEQGAVLPGASIVITSTALVAGQMTATSDDGGQWRFPSLSPGIYSVKVEISGFQGVVREGVPVQVGQTSPVDFTLKVSSVQETVTVAATSATVDTTSANVSVNLGEELLQSTPGGRDIWALIETKVPGLVMSRPDVGGTSGGLQGTYSARGTTSAQNSQFLNGINVGDPAAPRSRGKATTRRDRTSTTSCWLWASAPIPMKSTTCRT